MSKIVIAVILVLISILAVLLVYACTVASGIAEDKRSREEEINRILKDITKEK